MTTKHSNKCGSLLAADGGHRPQQPRLTIGVWGLRFTIDRGSSFQGAGVYIVIAERTRILGILAATTLPPRASHRITGDRSGTIIHQPLNPQPIWVYLIIKIPIYPIFYLLKGDDNSKKNMYLHLNRTNPFTYSTHSFLYSFMHTPRPS